MTELPKNSIEGKAKPYLERIENIHEELESLRGTYMSECKALREDIRDIITEAKDKGVPPKALRRLVEHRKLEKRQGELAAGLDEEEAEAFERLVEALGPLGRAAAEKAGHTPKSGGADPNARADEEQLAHVGKGAAAKSDAVDSLTSKH